MRGEILRYDNVGRQLSFERRREAWELFMSRWDTVGATVTREFGRMRTRFNSDNRSMAALHTSSPHPPPPPPPLAASNDAEEPKDFRVACAGALFLLSIFPNTAFRRVNTHRRGPDGGRTCCLRTPAGRACTISTYGTWLPWLADGQAKSVSCRKAAYDCSTAARRSVYVCFARVRTCARHCWSCCADPIVFGCPAARSRRAGGLRFRSRRRSAQASCIGTVRRLIDSIIKSWNSAAAILPRTDRGGRPSEQVRAACNVVGRH